MGGHLVQQEIPGPGVKQERDGHIDHQEAPENPKWEVWLDATPDVVVPVRVPGAAGSKGGDPTCQEAWGLVRGGGDVGRAAYGNMPGEKRTEWLCSSRGLPG